MKKVFYPLACCCLAAGVFASCGGQKKANAPEEQKVALTYSKSLKAAETDSLNLPVDENGYITTLMAKHLTDGVVMEKTVFLLNGQLKTVVSNSTVLVAVKLKTVMVVT